jgi:hypothetical protein|tara:strand:+ start:1506 stop:1718 length:213 start_codon:yes stop_codon:yes gene_type:complete
MKKVVEYTEEEIFNNKKTDLVNDLIAISVVKEELWRYHPNNPKKVDVVTEYDDLDQMEKDIELELAELKS